MVTPPAMAAPEPAPSPEPEFDADIAAIFSEEASELLEQADAALLNWSRDRADRRQVTELKRLLHTLKGGSRMAGIRAMGDLSHEMESFLAALESGTVASDQDAIGALQASLDELHHMRDLANAGHRIAPAVGLIERIHAVAAASSRAPLPAETAVPVEAAPEPTEAVAPVEAVAPAEAPAPAEAVAAFEAEVPAEEPPVPAIEVAPAEAAVVPAGK
jgi:chemosensory pili system protein ChpA (sensor histidine kinase/response regulator)